MSVPLSSEPTVSAKVRNRKSERVRRMRNKIAGVAANTMVKCIDSFVLNVDDDSNIISTRNSYTASVQGGGNLGMHTK